MFIPDLIPSVVPAVTPDAGSTMPDVSSILIVYGPLGLMTAIAVLVAAKLYRDNRSDRTATDAQLKAERQKCEDEKAAKDVTIRALEDRLIAKAETWMEKYNEVAKATAQVLDSVFKQRNPPGGGS